MKLTSIGIANFRSLGEKPVMIDLRRRATALIGANNSGKSNVLTGFIKLSEGKGELRKIEETDRHQRRGDTWPRLAMEAEVEAGDDLPGFCSGERLRFVHEFQAGLSSGWVEHPLSSLEFNHFNDLMQKTLRRHFTRRAQQQELETYYPEICASLCAPLVGQIPQFTLIPQYRQIVSGSSYEVRGTGIIELLASWERPDIGKEEDAHRFAKIERLLRHLLRAPDARLVVSYKNQTIIVQRDALRLPLESYGTGLHQVIILAIAVMSRDNVIFCIEEPEIHLHPTLQREFMQFLIGETNNRYIIATHSPALIDPGPHLEVIHLEISSHTTIPQIVQTPLDTLFVLRDLGIQPSDLLQANAVIWVEGPSDRIYIKRWLELLAPDLVEGIHFSIMFYGGRLLSHLALDRSEDASEMISLLRIAQNSAVLIDSDKRSRRQQINSTKQRVEREGANTDAYVWITEGREIENLIPTEAIASCYEKMTGTRPNLQFGLFDSLEDALENAYGRAWQPKFSYNNFKPERARQIVEFIGMNTITPQVLERVSKLIQLIRNGPQLKQRGEVLKA